MNCAIVVQTCDKYEPFWDGFFHFMGKQWDRNIKCPIYFCNEEKNISAPSGFKQIKTGKNSFIQNLNNILNSVQEDHVFYMLEDFWPTAPMGKELFEELYDCFLENDLDALQASSFLPYYELEAMQKRIASQNVFRFKKNSEWIFNFQARFWKKDSLQKCLVEPEISESVVGSAITAEIQSDKFARENMDLQVLLFHHFWYPISGVAYRGKLTAEGEQMKNVMNIDKYVKDISEQVSSQSPLEVCSQ
jgi:hypothetical protein